MIDVTGIGIGSVTHHTAHKAVIAAVHDAAHQRLARLDSIQCADVSVDKLVLEFRAFLELPDRLRVVAVGRVIVPDKLVNDEAVGEGIGEACR